MKFVIFIVNQNIMRVSLIIFFFVFNEILYSQNIDSLRVKYLNKRVVILNNDIKYFINRVNNSNNLDTTNLLSLQLKEKCTPVIDSVYKIYRLGDDDSYMSSVYYGLAGAYSISNPGLSAAYSAMGTFAIFDDNSLTPPKYYQKLKDVRYYASRMSRTKKLQKAKKLNGKLSKVFYGEIN